MQLGVIENGEGGKLVIDSRASLIFCLMFEPGGVVCVDVTAKDDIIERDQRGQVRFEVRWGRGSWGDVNIDDVYVFVIEFSKNGKQFGGVVERGE